MANTDTFRAACMFCSDCGSILPSLGEVGGVSCYTCSKDVPPNELGNSKVKYTIHFNSIDAYEKNKREKKHNEKDEDDEEGPVVDRKCPQCGNEKMSYATVQLRSADEGQTVFYTCTKCKFKENENS